MHQSLSKGVRKGATAFTDSIALMDLFYKPSRPLQCITSLTVEYYRSTCLGAQAIVTIDHAHNTAAKQIICQSNTGHVLTKLANAGLASDEATEGNRTASIEIQALRNHTRNLPRRQYTLSIFYAHHEAVSPFMLPRRETGLLFYFSPKPHEMLGHVTTRGRGDLRGVVCPASMDAWLCIGEGLAVSVCCLVGIWLVRNVRKSRYMALLLCSCARHNGCAAGGVGRECLAVVVRRRVNDVGVW